MSFKKNDVITFDTDEKVLVLQAIKHDGVEYLYAAGLLPDESDTTGKFEILEANYSTGTLDRVVDLETLQVLIPIFNELMQKEVQEG